jgi:hypothetical protein
MALPTQEGRLIGIGNRGPESDSSQSKTRVRRSTNAATRVAVPLSGPANGTDVAASRACGKRKGNAAATGEGRWPMGPGTLNVAQRLVILAGRSHRLVVSACPWMCLTD